MFGTMDLQIQYLLLLQEFRSLTNGFFDNFFLLATQFGEVIIPICIISAIYWCINKRAGQFILFTFGLTLYTNVFLKMAMCIKRPWLISPEIKPIASALPHADGYSFPSGHTAGATALWGSIAYKWWNNKLIRYTMITIVLLVAFSRNYIGVHTPQDVIVSILVGIILFFIADNLLKWIDKNKNNDLILYATILVLTTILYTFIHIKCNLQLQSFNPTTDNINPLVMKHGTYPKIGFMLGIFTGWILEKRFINFQITESWNFKKVLSLFWGISILIILLTISSRLLSLFCPSHIAYGLNAFIITFYITFIYPIILKKFNN